MPRRPRFVVPILVVAPTPPLGELFRPHHTRHVLPADAPGKIAVSDLLLKPSSSPPQMWLRLALRLMGVPGTNLWTAAQYEERLKALGFDEVSGRGRMMDRGRVVGRAPNAVFRFSAPTLYAGWTEGGRTQWPHEPEPASC